MHISGKSSNHLDLMAYREPCGLYKTLLVLSKSLLWVDASERDIPRSQDDEILYVSILF